MLKVTQFGRYIRKLRIDHGMILKDLADALGVSSSYISAVELGKKNIPESFIEKLVLRFGINTQERAELYRIANESQPQVKIDLKDSTLNEREVVMAFARKYKHLTAEQQQRLKQFLEGD